MRRSTAVPKGLHRIANLLRIPHSINREVESAIGERFCNSAPDPAASAGYECHTLNPATHNAIFIEVANETRRCSVRHSEIAVAELPIIYGLRAEECVVGFIAREPLNI